MSLAFCSIRKGKKVRNYRDRVWCSHHECEHQGTCNRVPSIADMKKAKEKNQLIWWADLYGSGKCRMSRKAQVNDRH